MDSLALEYEYLLTSQLESQRDYYVGMVQKAQDYLKETEARAISAEKALLVRIF